MLLDSYKYWKYYLLNAASYKSMNDAKYNVFGGIVVLELCNYHTYRHAK
jgi:hypothetical protein